MKSKIMKNYKLYNQSLMLWFFLVFSFVIFILDFFIFLFKIIFEVNSPRKKWRTEMKMNLEQLKAKIESLFNKKLNRDDVELQKLFSLLTKDFPGKETVIADLLRKIRKEEKEKILNELHLFFRAIE